jgi:hypothetical protein
MTAIHNGSGRTRDAYQSYLADEDCEGVNLSSPNPRVIIFDHVRNHPVSIG